MTRPDVGGTLGGSGVLSPEGLMNMDNGVPSTVDEFLDASADYLEEHGWVQNRFHEPDTGRVCALGAIEGALQTSIVDTTVTVSWGRWREVQMLAASATRALADFWRAEGAVDRLDLDPVSCLCDRDVIAGVNDRVARDVEDVTSAMRKTAIQVREKVA